MNIINKTFLKLALLPSGLYGRMGVDRTQLRSILQTKLTMDDRRPNTFHQTNARRKNKPVSMATVGTMILSGIMGALFLFVFAIGRNEVTSLTVYFSLFFAMLSASLISGFTSVLIDVRDTFIILPKPVNDRTFVLARLLHISIHILKIVLPMALPGMIYIAVQYSVGGLLAFLFLILLLTAFSIFFINAVYLLILKVTTPQKFQSIISYIQIIFAILVYGGYQIIPRMVTRFGLGELDLNAYRGIVAFPMYWFAACWNLLTTFRGSVQEVIGAVLAILVPLFSLYVVVRYLAPSFNTKLAMINGSGGETPTATKTKARKGGRYADTLAKLTTTNTVEKMGFLFAWKMTGRSRDFKLKVYPGIGYLLVYVVIMFFNTRSFSLENISEQGSKGQFLVIAAIYFSSLLLTMGISQMIYSEKYKASWIYYTAPIERPGEVILGAAKAAIFKFYIPLVCLITATALVLIGPAVLPNIFLGLFNQLLIATMLVYIGHKFFPFSLHQSNQSKAGNFLRSFSLLLVSALIAVGHYMIYHFTIVILICCVLSVIATWLLMGSIRNSTWNEIKSNYIDHS